MPQATHIMVLIEHSDALISAGLAATLRRRRGFKVVFRSPDSTVVNSRESAGPSWDVAVADYDSGMRLLASEGTGRDRVMILTDSDSEARICHALEQGTRGYLLLGCSIEDLIDALRSIHVGGIALAPLVVTRVADRLKQQALTKREEEILAQIMLGLSNKRIAVRMAVAVGTVKAHVKSILGKLDATSRTEAVAIAQRRGLLRGEFERSDPDGVARRASLSSPADALRNAQRRIRRLGDAARVYHAL
jgi:DNA-binding NarL/FixJ family response regulator